MHPTRWCAGGAEAVFTQEEGKAVGLGKDAEPSPGIRLSLWRRTGAFLCNDCHYFQ